MEEHARLFDVIRYALGEFGGFSLYVGRRRFYPIQVANRLPRLPDDNSGARGLLDRNSNLLLRRAMIGDILLLEGTQSRTGCLPVALHSFVGNVFWWATRLGIKLSGSEERVMVRRNISTVLVAAAVIVILLVAFILSRAQHKLPELALDLIVYLFATTLAVFVIGRILAWRENRRWIVAKDWLHMILLETIDDLLKVLLPAAVPREGIQTDEELTVYEVAGERIHFGETVAYSQLQLLVRPGEKDLQSHIFWYASELGPPRYAELAKEALSEAREQVRDMLATSGQLLEADITAMVMSFDQAIAAAIRHLDSAAIMRNEKLKELKDAPFHDGEVSTTQRTSEADNELAFVSSIIVESVVDSAIKPKGWLEHEMLDREGQSPFRGLRA